MSKMTGAQAIVKSLRAQGIDTIFALPGGQLDHLFDAIYQEGDNIRLIWGRIHQAHGGNHEIRMLHRTCHAV